MESDNTIISRLMYLIENSGLSKRNLAEHLGVSPSTVSNWTIRGTDPPACYAIPICEFYGCDLYWFLTGKERKPQTEMVLDKVEEKWLALLRKIPTGEREQVALRLSAYFNGWIDAKYGEKED